MWDLDTFERGYAQTGYYEDNWDHARRGAVPIVVEQYRYPRVKGWILDAMRPRAGGLYLDVGSGVGMMFFKLTQRYPHVDFRMIALDASCSHLLPLAQRKQAQHATAVLPIAGDAERLPFPSDTFDGIICTEVLEHIFNKQKALHEIARVLKPGGEVFLTTPSRTAVGLWHALFWLPRRFHRLLRGKGWTVHETGPYDAPVNARALRRMFRRAGLHVRELTAAVYLPHESYFQFLPDAATAAVLRVGATIERCSGGRCAWLGLHLRAACVKRGGKAT